MSRAEIDAYNFGADCHNRGIPLGMIGGTLAMDVTAPNHAAATRAWGQLGTPLFTHWARRGWHEADAKTGSG